MATLVVALLDEDIFLWVGVSAGKVLLLEDAAPERGEAECFLLESAPVFFPFRSASRSPAPPPPSLLGVHPPAMMMTVCAVSCACLLFSFPTPNHHTQSKPKTHARHTQREGE